MRDEIEQASLGKIEFFEGYFRHLLEANIDYVILHSYENYPEETPSDIDYCVRDNDLRKIPKLLREYCHSTGWRMVQILQHEYCAYYCVCISIQTPGDFLLLDVSSHYVREGRLLIRDDDFLDGGHPHPVKRFQIPSSEVEVSYILWKAAAKSKELGPLTERLSQLGVEENGTELTGAQLSKLQSQLSMTLPSGSIHSVHEALVTTYKKLPAQSRLSQIKKLIRRAMRPTGCLCVLPEDGDSERLLKCALPAFRRTAVVKSTRLKEWESLVRSTLILTEKASWLIRMIAKLGHCFIDLSEKSERLSEAELLDWLDERVTRQWNLK